MAKDKINGRWVKIISDWQSVLVVQTSNGAIYFRFQSQLE